MVSDTVGSNGFTPAERTQLATNSMTTGAGRPLTDAETARVSQWVTARGLRHNVWEVLEVAAAERCNQVLVDEPGDAHRCPDDGTLEALVDAIVKALPGMLSPVLEGVFGEHRYSAAYGGCSCGTDYEDSALTVDAEFAQHDAHLEEAVLSALQENLPERRPKE